MVRERSTVSDRSALDIFFPFSLRPTATFSNTDMRGNGFGCWKTIPTRRRRYTGSIFSEWMSTPSSRIRPLIRNPGVMSCIRLRHRMKVLFPHPEGPITEVTECFPMSIRIFFSTWFSPNQLLRSWISKTFSIALPSSYRFCRVRTRAAMLIRRTIVIRTRAPAHALSCQSS